MSHYDQAMRHFRNHKKDRFYQQCSGYTGTPAEESTPAPIDEAATFRILMEKLPTDASFPVCIRQGSLGIWSTTAINDCFGTVIESRAALEQIYSDLYA